MRKKTRTAQTEVYATDNLWLLALPVERDGNLPVAISVADRTLFRVQKQEGERKHSASAVATGCCHP